MSSSEERKQLVKQGLTPGTFYPGVKPVKLLANFYPFITSDVIMYHYDVNITKSKKKVKGENEPKPKLKKLQPEVGQSAEKTDRDPTELFIKKFSPVIFAQFKAGNPRIFSNIHSIYDEYKNLYTTKELNLPESGEFVQKADINGKPEFFKIMLRLVESVDLSEVSRYYKGEGVMEVSERTISVFEIIFRSLFVQAGYTWFQRKFFDAEKSERPMRDAQFKIHDFVRGCMNSVRMTECGLMMNVHLKTSCIISRSWNMLIEVVTAYTGFNREQLEKGQLQGRAMGDLNKMLRHLEIFTEHTGTKMSFKVNFILRQTPKENNFEIDGKRITLHQYFQQKYNITLKNLPLVQTTKSRIILPLELCLMKDKQFLSNARLNADIQAELLIASTHSPNIYFNHSNEIVKRIGGVADAQGKAFGIGTVSLKPIAISGRVLPAPAMKFAGMNDKFFKPLPPMVWAFYCFDNQIKQEELDNFIAEMRKEANAFGLKLNEPRQVVIKKVDTLNHVRQACDAIVADPTLKNLDLLFCGFPKSEFQFWLTCFDCFIALAQSTTASFKLRRYTIW